MACRCTDNNKLNDNKRLNNDKKFNIESVQNLSLDEIIDLYRQGYTLDNADSVQEMSNINALSYNTQCSGDNVIAFNNAATLQGTLGEVQRGKVWAQRFYGDFRCLEFVQFYMTRDNNVSFYIEIRKDDGLGDGKPLGVPLANDSGLVMRSAVISYLDIPQNPAWGWVYPQVAAILPTNAYYWICLVPVDFYDSATYRVSPTYDRFGIRDGAPIADKRSAVFKDGGWSNSSTFAFAIFKKPTFTTPSSAQVFNMCWGPGLGAQCSIPPEQPVITSGTTVTIKADISNSGSTGQVRAVFKINGSTISDQTSSLGTYPGGGFWSPTTTYVMPSSNVTLTVEGYGWDGSAWILTDTRSATISATTPTCTGISIDASTVTANIGDNITLIAYGVTPTTQAFTINFLDRSNNVLGTCTTSSGTCSSVWNTTGLAPGQYYVRATVTGQCTSTELAIGLSLPVIQWNVDITVLDDVTSNPIPTANVTIGVRILQTDTNGHVLFTGVDQGTINVSITKSGYNDSLTNPESLYSNITRTYRLVPVSQNPGSLRFMTSPPGISGAEVHFIGDIPTLKGTTDTNGIFLIGSLTAGRVVNYEVRKTTYNTATGSVTVVGNTTTDVIVTMTPVSTTGSVCIHSNPSGASIKIDTILQTGKSTALSGGGCVAVNTIDNLSAGSHNYELTLTSYQNKTGTFSITVGQTLDYDAGTLTPIPTLGTLNISSSPSGARIYIKVGGIYQDTGYVTGTTSVPTVITTLTAGTYEYKLVLASYVDYVNTFVIIASQTTTVDVTLTQLCSSISNVVPSPSTAIVNNPVILSADVSPAGAYTIEFFNSDNPTQVFASKTETTSTTTYSATWTPTTVGTYHIKARMGAQCISTNPVTVAVVTCTAISLVASPTSGTIGVPINLTATVTNPPNIAGFSVTIKDGTTTLTTATTNSSGVVTYVWDTSGQTVGSHSLTANVGTQCTSPSRTVNLTQPPQPCAAISLVASPISGIIGTIINLTAIVTNPPNTAGYNVIVKDGTTILTTITTNSSGIAMYAWDTSGQTAGSHSLTANVGTQCISPSRTVDLTAPSQPCITISLVANPTSVRQGQSITLTATVTNPPNTAGYNVDFKVDGYLVATRTTNSSGIAVYTLNTSSLTVDTHNIIVNVGTQCTSSTVVINVTMAVTEAGGGGIAILALAALAGAILMRKKPSPEQKSRSPILRTIEKS